MIAASEWPSSSSWARIAPDAAVHHVARGDHVGAGVGVRDRGLREQLEREVVVDLAVADDAAVPMRGVFAQAHVGDHEEIRVGLLQRADGELDDPLRVVGARAGLVLLARDAEQDHGADPGRLELCRLGDELGDREPLHARHRGHLVAHALAGDHEQRLHEVLGGEIRLAYQVAQCLRAPRAPHAGGRKAHAPDSRSRVVRARLGGPAWSLGPGGHGRQRWLLLGRPAMLLADWGHGAA